MDKSESSTADNQACPICGTRGSTLINLSGYPVTEIYQKFGENSFHHPVCYDQGLNFCEECSHGYLNALLPRNFIYENYNTHTASSIGSLVAINNFYKFITGNLKGKHNLIIDIGANDTTLLKKFKDTGARLIGVDPNVSSDDPEIECVNGYIEDVDIRSFGSASKLFLCSHTLEHIFNPAEFLEKLHSASIEGDEYFFQFPSLDLLIRDGRFDQVHHQHIQYFSLHSFSKLLSQLGFELVAHCFDADHYGTLMGYFRKKKNGVSQSRIGNKYGSSQVLLSYHTFTAALTSANQRLEIDPRGFSCYGASLMLPILSYYMSNLIKAEVILDSNRDKFEMSYVNFDVRITDAGDFDYADANIVVTAISTKLATRRIILNLINAGAQNIILPYNTL